MTSPTLARITLGTAGHIDHGKTALVKALTGVETDRLKEEKRRGITIDLGLRLYDTPGRRDRLVDVPGHERFVNTMVAGANGRTGRDSWWWPLDDGVMPQTREHMEILTLLGVRHGLVALTEIDRVADDLRELAMADVAEFLRGTFLDGAPIVPLSNMTFEGFRDVWTRPSTAC